MKDVKNQKLLLIIVKMGFLSSPGGSSVCVLYKTAEAQCEDGITRVCSAALC